VDIYLCIWHVERCWLDHLCRKVKDFHRRNEMFQALRQIMFFREDRPSAEVSVIFYSMLDRFYSTYAAEHEFVAYFKKTWHNKAGMVPILFNFKLTLSCCRYHDVDVLLESSSVSWLPSVLTLHAGLWALAFRKASRANQNTNSGVEGYHGGMKGKFRELKPTIRGRYLAWLVFTLLSVILAAYRDASLRKEVR
jgi:hypothetical protein